MKKIFSKVLSRTDVKKRLIIPTDSPWMIPISKSVYEIDLSFQDATTGIVWIFQHSVRHSKRMLSDGWLEFVRIRGLQPGHRVTIYSNKKEAIEVTYIIRVQRKIFRLFGQDLLWTDLHPQKAGHSSNGSSHQMEDTDTHLNNELSLPLLSETKHIIDINQSDVNHGMHHRRSRKVILERIFDTGFLRKRLQQNCIVDWISG